MNKAYLQTLDLELELEDYQFIREVGIVPNLADHFIETSSEFGYTRNRSIEKLIEKYGNLSDVHGGVCSIYTEPSASLYDKPREICVIAVEKTVPIIECFSLGEEETHALQHFSKVGKLNEIRDQFGLTLDISEFTGSDRERHYLQKLGGFFALLRKGYDLMDKEFTREFMDKGIKIMGYSQTIPSLQVLLVIKNDWILNVKSYLIALERNKN
jgi:hypothetical protein